MITFDSKEISSWLTENVRDMKTIAQIDESLPVLMAAFVTQTKATSDDAGKMILDQYKNKASVVRRRTTKAAATTYTKEERPMSVEDSDGTYTRPNGSVYYSRDWNGFRDVDVLRESRELEQYILLYGAPGCGKTALVEAAFAGELHTILGSGDTEVADLVGGYTQSPEGGWLWTDGPLLKAAEDGQPLLIDEIGLIDPKVLSIVYGLMDGRREYTVTANPERGTVKAKKGFYVVGATNPNAPGVRISEALLSRFAIHAEMTTDWTLASKLGVSSDMVNAAQNLAKKQAAGEISWAPQFRELENFRDIERVRGARWAVANLLAVAPEMDRPVVAEILSRAYGQAMLPARI